MTGVENLAKRMKYSEFTKIASQYDVIQISSEEKSGSYLVVKAGKQKVSLLSLDACHEMESNTSFPLISLEYDKVSQVSQGDEDILFFLLHQNNPLIEEAINHRRGVK